MFLNLSKSKHLFINKSLRDVISAPIPISNSVKYLGIACNNKCTWNDHCHQTVKLCNRRLHGLRRLRFLLDKDQLLTVYMYNSTIQSVIEYAAPLFCGLSENELKLLSRIQKRNHLVTCGRNCSCSCFPPINDRMTLAAKKLFLIL